MVNKFTDIQDVANATTLFNKLNEIIDQINSITYVLTIPLGSIKQQLDDKQKLITDMDNIIKLKDEQLVNKDNEIKITREKLDKLK